jgi:UDP-N-acetylglucosamine 4,6-dehydratase
MSLNNKSILITGGTGSFGVAFVNQVLKSYPKIKRLVVFSRDELKQEQMRIKFPTEKYKNLRYFIGDVRDYQRLLRAVDGIEIIIHAAALKQVPTAEYNPIEFIKTNIIGAQNIIEASIEKKIQKVIALSSDKASAPINLYGATKLCSDKLFVAANNYAGKNCSFTVVRYGNVMGSRGSVIPKLIDQAKKGFLNITDTRMTRFNITLQESVQMVLFAITNAHGSEILVPKIPSYNIMDLAKAIGPNCKIKKTGIRPGEKIHEEMITESDSYNTYDIDKYFIILPGANTKIIKMYKKFKIKPVKLGFSYNSGKNKNFLSIKEIKTLIEKNITKV